MSNNEKCLLQKLPYVIKIRLMECLSYLSKQKVAEIDTSLSKFCKKPNVKITEKVSIEIMPHSIIIEEKVYPFSIKCCSAFDLKKIIDESDCFPTKNLHIINEYTSTTKDSEDPIKCIVTHLLPYGFVVAGTKNEEKNSKILKLKVQKHIHELLSLKEFVLENVLNKFLLWYIRLNASDRISSLYHNILLHANMMP